MTNKEAKEIAKEAIANGWLTPPSKEGSLNANSAYRLALKDSKLEKIYTHLKAKWDAENDTSKPSPR